jgi:hypothetical protein
MNQQTRVAVIIYAYKTDVETLKLVQNLKDDFFAFVIDDYPMSSLSENAKDAHFYYLNQYHVGYAQSMLKAYKLCLNYGEFESIVTIPADQYYNWQTVYSMLGLVDNYDIVNGSRHLSFSTFDTAASSWYSGYVSRLKSRLFSLVQREEVTDWFSKFRLYRSELLAALLRENYSSQTEVMQAEILAKALKLNATVFEYPVDYKAKESQINLRETLILLWRLLITDSKKPKQITKNSFW